MLPLVAEYKPDLKELILHALASVDVTPYPESMQSLIIKDIQKSRKQITTEQ